MSNPRIERLRVELKKAEDANDHILAKSIMQAIENEHEKEALRKWVWYRG